MPHPSRSSGRFSALPTHYSIPSLAPNLRLRGLTQAFKSPVKYFAIGHLKVVPIGFGLRLARRQTWISFEKTTLTKQSLACYSASLEGLLSSNSKLWVPQESAQGNCSRKEVAARMLFADKIKKKTKFGLRPAVSDLGSVHVATCSNKTAWAIRSRRPSCEATLCHFNTLYFVSVGALELSRSIFAWSFSK